MEVTHIEEIAKHTTAVTDAMFAPRVQLTPEEKIAKVLTLTKEIELLLDQLEHDYLDARCNISESKRMAGDIIENMQGHRRDVEAGLE
jgi:hypothetical protein